MNSHRTANRISEMTPNALYLIDLTIIGSTLSTIKTDFSFTKRIARASPIPLLPPTIRTFCFFIIPNKYYAPPFYTILSSLQSSQTLWVVAGNCLNGAYISLKEIPAIHNKPSPDKYKSIFILILIFVPHFEIICEPPGRRDKNITTRTGNYKISFRFHSQP